MEKKYCTVNNSKKVITIDETVMPTRSDEIFINAKINEGFTIRKKSQKKSKQAKARAKENNLKKADIVEALKNDSAKKDEFLKLLNEKGFFKAKAWYLKSIEKEKDKETKK